MLELIYSISEKFRDKRQTLFLETFNLKPQSRLKILDLGGHPGLTVFERFQHNCEIVYLNIYPPSKFSNSLADHETYIQGDARTLPFPDSCFDLVYCNSLLEHVGDLEEQRKVTQEIMRVGKKYWVQTPYKHFPIEPHYNFPLFQYLPENIKMGVYDYWPYSHYKKHSLEYEEIFLLNIGQVKSLFPNATQFYFEKLGPLTKSVVAIKN